LINACIIGISGYGKVHYDLLTAEQAAGNLNIVGAAVINQDEEQDRCAHLSEISCRIYDDYAVMLKELSGIADICFIPTGTPLHMPMTVAAVEAGMHVFVEKPAAGALQDVRAMQKASDKANKLVAVGYQQMYDPTTLQIKRAILDNDIGAAEGIKCRVTWPRDSVYYNRNNWAGRLRIGDTWVLDSPFNNAVAHDLMMMLFLAGPTEREPATPLSVEAELYRANDIESADTACIRIQTDTGIPLLFYATHACSKFFGPELCARGSAGSISWEHNAADIEPEGEAKQVLDKLTGDPLRKNMMSSVLDVLNGGTSFYCDLEAASRQTIVVNAVHQACEIHTVASEQETLDNRAVRTTIPGVEDAIDKAFTEEKLFSEIGTPWAKPSSTLDCVNYQGL
jgi:predicted dehydrogenase